MRNIFATFAALFALLVLVGVIQSNVDVVSALYAGIKAILNGIWSAILAIFT